MTARRTWTPRVGATIVYTDQGGNTVRGTVWSLGPFAGHVWVTPYPTPIGGSGAVLVVTRGGKYLEVGRA